MDKRDIDRLLTHSLDEMAGAVSGGHLQRRVAGLLATADLRVEPIDIPMFAVHLQQLGATPPDLSVLIDCPDWHGVASGAAGRAFVLAEASLTWVRE